MVQSLQHMKNKLTDIERIVYGVPTWQKQTINLKTFDRLFFSLLFSI